MANTITSFYEFSAGTKARSTQVNANFDVFRGHSVPVDPNTAAAAALTYDLGSTEYRWRDLYARGINLIGMTTTANLGIARDNAVTGGSYPIQIGGASVGELRSTGVWTKKNYVKTEFTTATITAAAYSTIAASVMSLTTYGGVLHVFTEGSVPTSTGNAQVYFSNNTSAGHFLVGDVALYVDGSIASAHTFGEIQATGTAGTLEEFFLPMGALLSHHVFDLAAGGHTLYLGVRVLTTTCAVVLKNCRFVAMEK